MGVQPEFLGVLGVLFIEGETQEGQGSEVAVDLVVGVHIAVGGNGCQVVLTQGHFHGQAGGDRFLSRPNR